MDSHEAGAAPLDNRYGSSQKISEQLIQKLDQFPTIKGPNQGDSLQSFHDLCKVILFNMPKCPELMIMNLSTGLRHACVKLPERVQRVWRKCVQDYEDLNGGSHPPFQVLVNFLNKQAKQLSN